MAAFKPFSTRNLNRVFFCSFLFVGQLIKKIKINLRNRIIAYIFATKRFRKSGVTEK